MIDTKDLEEEQDETSRRKAAQERHRVWAEADNERARQEHAERQASDLPAGANQTEAKIWAETKATRERFGPGRSMGWPNLSPSVFFVAPEHYEEGHSGRLYVGDEFVELDTEPLGLIDAKLALPGHGAYWLDWNFTAGQDPAVPTVKVRTPHGFAATLTADQWLDGMNFLARAQIDQVEAQARGQRMTGTEDDAAAFRAELERSGLVETGEREIGGEMAHYRVRSVDFLAPGTVAATKGPNGEWYGCAVTVGAEVIDLSQGEWERIVLAIETIAQDKAVDQDSPHAISIGRWQFGFFPAKHQVVFATGEHQMGHLAYGDWIMLVAQIRAGFEEPETEQGEVAPETEFQL